MTKFYLNFNTGYGYEEFEGTLEEAMREADDYASYTQESIDIYDENYNLVASRSWCGVDFDNDRDLYESDEPDVIVFGSYGYYDEWLFA